jgi:preprotein translocase subunit SecF
MVEFEVPEFDYTDYSNRELAAVPLAVLGVALLILVGWYVVTGAPVSPGIEFTGGTEVRIQTADSPDEIEATFSEVEFTAVQPVAGADAYILTTQSDDIDQIQSTADAAGYNVLSSQSRSPSFGSSSQTQALYGVLIAFAGMSVLVFLLFRTFVPSIAVVVSAFSDIMIPLAVMNVFGIKLSLGTVAALLMLIGYSVDSDLLLNNHILRRRGTFYESAFRAIRTGITMTLTSIAAMIMMTVVATILAIPLLPEIGLVLTIGLTADLMNTYLLNMSLLRWYKFEGVTQ